MDDLEFPRLVYKSPEIHLLVENEDEQKAAIEAGWFATVPEALAQKTEPLKTAEEPVKKAGWK